ncbi:MAG: ethanolamine utilization protein EutJ [Anaerolineae bacterium]
MNPELDRFLRRAVAVLDGSPDGSAEPPARAGGAAESPGAVHVGVDLGTAYTVLVVLDAQRQPLAGAYRFAQVVRDGLVVDFHGATQLVRELKAQVERRLGFTLTTAATAYPPGVPLTEVHATRHVIEAADLICRQVVDEPTAANAVLQVRDGAVVDVGGGTTGIAVFRRGQVVYTADEPTGGSHFSLVIAGALDIDFEEAEALKKDAGQHRRLFPLVRPVMEKVGTIIARHLAQHPVETIYLVGGTACFTGIERVVQEVTGVKTLIPGQPMFVTPLGVAMHNIPETEASDGR